MNEPDIYIWKVFLSKPRLITDSKSIQNPPNNPSHLNIAQRDLLSIEKSRHASKEFSFDNVKRGPQISESTWPKRSIVFGSQDGYRNKHSSLKVCGWQTYAKCPSCPSQKTDPKEPAEQSSTQPGTESLRRLQKPLPRDPPEGHREPHAGHR